MIWWRNMVGIRVRRISIRWWRVRRGIGIFCGLNLMRSVLQF